MAKRKRPAAQKPAPDEATLAPAQETQIFTGSGGPSLHDLFQQQARAVLDQSDLDEQAKQSILTIMNCPCCGAGGMNYVAKIKRKR
jgi:hypothetical protein